MKYHLVEATWPAGGQGLVHVKRFVFLCETKEAAMNEAEKKLFFKADMEVTEVPAHKFNVGDRVSFTNDAGTVWTGWTITELGEPFTDGIPRYYCTPTDTPWFSFEETCLTLEASAELAAS